MNGFEKSLNSTASLDVELAMWPPRNATEHDIAVVVAHAKELRAMEIARFGRQVGQTIGSLWRRPGRLLPAAAQ
ncbi:MAG: hypothetical protein P9C48_03810 [Defluviicoccus sp.]|nr:hypothetical protein [Defluviicoccus sp.]MDG4608234.1 hypothetical protein [Defluviicoccus sp.]